jgi:hypothetical protein
MVPDLTLEELLNDPEKLKAALDALNQLSSPIVATENAPPVADECHPDVWDSQGRLISHPFNVS